jgi:NADPH-dependent 2,4-dienoyl-CoA reductase/sulfur reductase-like enzyme
MRVVIIGNSAAALAAAEALRRYDAGSELLLVAAEEGPAYSRVLLPYYLRGILPRARLFIRDRAWYERLRIQTRFGCAVTRVDDQRRTLLLADGTVLAWDRLLIASGARPVLPRAAGLQGPGIHTLWTLQDADGLLPELLPGRRAAFIGSGFVSLQAAWSACLRGLRVTVLEVLSRILPKVLDETGSALLERRMREHGVEVRCAVGIERVERRPAGEPGCTPTGISARAPAAAAPLRVVLSCEDPNVDADLVLVAAGVRPNLEFLEGTSVALAAGGAGVLVDAQMRSSVPEIYAAGDAALGPSVFGEAHAAHALWPTAVEQGRVAGANMAGAEMVGGSVAGRQREYQGSLNMNVAELFGLTVASMGRFQESGDPEEKAVVEHDPGAGRYLKLLFHSGVPVGGLVLGEPEDLAVLSALRPRIRARRPASLVPARPLAALHRVLARPAPHTPYARS